MSSNWVQVWVRDYVLPLLIALVPSLTNKGTRWRVRVRGASWHWCRCCDTWSWTVRRAAERRTSSAWCITLAVAIRSRRRWYNWVWCRRRLWVIWSFHRHRCRSVANANDGRSKDRNSDSRVSSDPKQKRRFRHHNSFFLLQLHYICICDAVLERE